MVLVGLACVLALASFALRALFLKETPIRPYVKWASRLFSTNYPRFPKQDVQVKIFKRQEVEAFDRTTWQYKSYDAFKGAILSEDPVAFPCIYATKGFKARDHRYIFVESEDMSHDEEMTAMATALQQYLGTPPSELGPNTSLVVLFPIPSSPLSVEEYYQKYWDCLHGLRARDPKSWPGHIPTDTDTPMWRFCFDGQPIFSASLTPAHTKRRSRYAPCFCIVFQPNFVFDILFSTPLKKKSAISKVRTLLGEYDDVSISPELKNYGDETGRECKQYFIMNENYAPSCPYSTLG
ncbi:uncharacterized protein N7479_009191 [Penicillium vulpinum]|uniref:YqcI/YcgG family protein n=1 Tax=Penicillium vulpinum TaxID=29845 RepID=A0A1V6RW84_9EURO|nr:uncharacterized protein N7479_009191 [Penicillium vulpinum]KAJ5950778.1 hypothetical protein N7479_009191 [Penicillium vulpinum]OQE05848.1 hypothetical protein PENVUL_c021G05619 [Penicillium vulpinum]